MAKEAETRRIKEREEEGFGGEAPLISPVMKGIRKLGKAINIIFTDRGLYENAKKRLEIAYNSAVAKIKRLFRRK